MTERTSITTEPKVEQETINPRPRHPFAGTDLDPARKGHQLRTIVCATDELWGGDTGVPEDVALRNREIWAWYEQQGIPEPWPTDRHLRRVFNDPRYSGQKADMSARSDTEAPRTPVDQVHADERHRGGRGSGTEGTQSGT